MVLSKTCLFHSYSSQGMWCYHYKVCCRASSVQKKTSKSTDEYFGSSAIYHVCVYGNFASFDVLGSDSFMSEIFLRVLILAREKCCNVFALIDDRYPWRFFFLFLATGCSEQFALISTDPEFGSKWLDITSSDPRFGTFRVREIYDLASLWRQTIWLLRHALLDQTSWVTDTPNSCYTTRAKCVNCEYLCRGINKGSQRNMSCAKLLEMVMRLKSL